MFKLSSNFMADHYKVVLLLWIFFLFVFCLSLTVLSVSCSLVVNCLERADLLALLYVMFSCVLVTFPCNILCQVYLTV